MAVKGQEAKNNVINKIALSFGDSYIGEDDKGKIYVWADDGVNGRVQIAMALTCPKIQLETSAETKIEDWNWEDEPAAKPAQNPVKAEVTQEEMDRIAEMMERLGL